MLIKHKYRNFQQNFLEKKLIYDEATPETIAGEFEKQKVDEKLNVEAAKQGALSKLEAAAKKSPGAMLQYTGAKDRIETKATEMKAVQSYYVERAKLGPNVDPVAITDATTYKLAVEREKAYGKLAVSKTAGGEVLANEPDYVAKTAEQKKTRDVFRESLVSGLPGSIDRLSDTYNKRKAKESNFDKDQFRADMDALKAKIDQYKLVKAADTVVSTGPRTITEPGEIKIRGIEEDYFAIYNLYNAQKNFDSQQYSDDKDKKKDATDWLHGAESLNQLRRARIAALNSIDKAKDKPGFDDLKEARQAWLDGEKLAKTDFNAAMLKFAEAQGYVDQFLDDKKAESNEKEKKENAEKKTLSTNILANSSKLKAAYGALRWPGKQMYDERAAFVKGDVDVDRPKLSKMSSGIDYSSHTLDQLKSLDLNLKTFRNIAESIRMAEQQVHNALLASASREAAVGGNSKTFDDYASDARALNGINIDGFSANDLLRLSTGIVLIVNAPDGKKSFRIAYNGKTNGTVMDTLSHQYDVPQAQTAMKTVDPLTADPKPEEPVVTPA